MRQGSPSPGGRRPRGRHSSNGGGGNGGGGPSNGRNNRSAASLRHQTFDSNGPEVRVRGNAWQVFEKYQSLARDARGLGDRVLAENYLQHAEHYFRVIEAINEATEVEQRQRGGPAAQPFGSQPDVPSNYYTPDGQLLGDHQPDTSSSMEGEPSQAEDSQNRNRAPRARSGPPSQPQHSQQSARDPFLAADEPEDAQGGPQKFASGA